MKITEKGTEPDQIIRSVFRKKYSIIDKSDQTGEGQFSQFTLRGNLWPTCLIKYRKLIV